MKGLVGAFLGAAWARFFQTSRMEQCYRSDEVRKPRPPSRRTQHSVGSGRPVRYTRLVSRTAAKNVFMLNRAPAGCSRR